MDKRERERRHQARLQQVNRVVVVCGRGDRARTDHEATLLERARLLSEEIASHGATERGIEALGRLLDAAEDRPSARTADIVRFIDALWNRRPLPLHLLRSQDSAAADDMLAVLDAFRHARLDLVDHADGGARRVAKLVNRVLGVAAAGR
jgi:hypothetical protein